MSIFNNYKSYIVSIYANSDILSCYKLRDSEYDYTYSEIKIYIDEIGSKKHFLGIDNLHDIFMCMMGELGTLLILNNFSNYFNDLFNFEIYNYLNAFALYLLVNKKLIYLNKPINMILNNNSKSKSFNSISSTNSILSLYHLSMETNVEFNIKLKKVIKTNNKVYSLSEIDEKFLSLFSFCPNFHLILDEADWEKLNIKEDNPVIISGRQVGVRKGNEIILINNPGPFRDYLNSNEYEIDMKDLNNIVNIVFEDILENIPNNFG